MFDFCLYNCMAMDRFGYANYSQSARREYAQHVERTLTVRSYSLVFDSWSLLVSYEHVLWSFQISFQVVMSSRDDHIRRIFKRMSAYSRFFYIFLQFVEGTPVNSL